MDILVRLPQLQCFSESANFILITTRTRSPQFASSPSIAWRTPTTVYDGVSIRLLRRLVHGYQLALCFIRERLLRWLQGSPLQATRG
jgi:hypothetical protein